MSNSYAISDTTNTYVVNGVYTTDSTAYVGTGWLAPLNTFAPAPVPTFGTFTYTTTQVCVCGELCDESSDLTLFVKQMWYCSVDCYHFYLLRSLEAVEEIA